jgi:hypothetical protein
VLCNEESCGSIPFMKIPTTKSSSSTIYIWHSICLQVWMQTSTWLNRCVICMGSSDLYYIPWQDSGMASYLTENLGFHFNIYSHISMNSIADIVSNPNLGSIWTHSFSWWPPGI